VKLGQRQPRDGPSGTPPHTVPGTARIGHPKGFPRQEASRGGKALRSRSHVTRAAGRAGRRADGANRLKGVDPDGWTPSARWERESDIPNRVLFRAYEALAD